MLQGSLDTVSFDEVLGFLASSSKTGILRVSGDRGTGSVWVTDGQMVAADTTHAASDSSIDEVVFELLRFNSGSFSFDFDETTTNPGSPIAIDSVLAQANKLLVEWRRIEEIIPSLDHRIIPAPRLPADQVTITEDEWTTLLAIGVGATAHDVAGTLQLGQLEGLRRIKGLVERKLVMVTDPQVGRIPDQPAMDSAAPEIPSKHVEAETQPETREKSKSETSEAPAEEPEVDSDADTASEPLGFEAPVASGSASASSTVPPPVAPSARRLSARRAVVEPTVSETPAPSVFESAIPEPPPAPVPPRVKVEDGLEDPFAADEVRPPMPPPPPPAPSAPVAADAAMNADVPPPPAPPSPAEIAKFGTSVEDVSSISDSASEEVDAETSLLMRYLQSEG